jgi:hypothetical protein
LAEASIYNSPCVLNALDHVAISRNSIFIEGTIASLEILTYSPFMIIFSPHLNVYHYVAASSSTDGLNIRTADHQLNITVLNDKAERDFEQGGETRN